MGAELARIEQHVDSFGQQTAEARFQDKQPDVLERAIAATHTHPLPSPELKDLDRDQKAAIIVRLLLGPDGNLPLSGLDTAATARLVRATASLTYVDEKTILAVIQDFLGEIDSLALYFQPGLEGAIETLGGLITDEVTQRLSFTPSSDVPDDPWIAVSAMDSNKLVPILARETPQICALVLSKLEATKSADILTELEADLAQAATQAALEIGRVEMSAMNNIGSAIVEAVHRATDLGALGGDPVDRVGAMLNFAPGKAREEMLSALQSKDAKMAEQVRRIMFTFGDIPDRVEVKDVPKLVRAVDNDTLVRALAGGAVTEKDSVDFILANLSKRLTEQLNEEVKELGEVKSRDADVAMNSVIQGIRALESSGEILLISGEE